MATAKLREELNCSICLTIYNNPVMLSCGHYYCHDCIDGFWNSQRSGVHICPECRQQFQNRPVLQRSRKLSNIVKCYSPMQPAREEGVIYCTYCVNDSVPAVRTCLHCEASLCDIHLKAHTDSAEHTLIKPTASLEGRKCLVHKELLKYYCSEDAANICVSCCLFGEHMGHRVELLNETFEKEMECKDALEKLTVKKEEIESRIEMLQECKRKVQEKTSGVKDRIAALFGDIREPVGDLKNHILSEVTRKEEQVLPHVTDKIQQLQIEKARLTESMLNSEELRNMQDPLRVLKMCGSTYSGFRAVEDEIKNIGEAGCPDERGISLTIQTSLQNLVPNLPNLMEKWGFFLWAASDILLDVSTASNEIIVSDDLKTVSFTNIKQEYPDGPERFSSSQILSTRSVSSGRYYWEVEIHDSWYWRVGVAYPSIERKKWSLIGFCNKSWCLGRRYKALYVIHDSEFKVVAPYSSFEILGIYLDYEAGLLSFYQVSDSIRHLYTVTTTFTEPLHAAFCVIKDGWMKIRNPAHQREPPM
ncbi:E3 ubiquitin-protein ligase TRIM11-like [Ascaphus truei]|uniref:E3 ubiquitin-protein ligase TRIM11-like n=1 Tax=Ascaphus truei TaxID=8439 RepID=UPI003F5A65A1